MTKRHPLDIPRRGLDLLAEGRAVKSTAPCAAIWGTVRRLTAARRWSESRRVSGKRGSFQTAEFFFELLEGATGEIHEQEHSDTFGGPPGSRYQRQRSVSRASRDAAHRPH